jgi:hypothetical protein
MPSSWSRPHRTTREKCGGVRKQIGMFEMAARRTSRWPCGWRVLPASIGGNAAGSTSHNHPATWRAGPGKSFSDSDNSRDHCASKRSEASSPREWTGRRNPRPRHKRGRTMNWRKTPGRKSATTGTCGTSAGLAACLRYSSQQRQDFSASSTINSKIIDLVMFESLCGFSPSVKQVQAVFLARSRIFCGAHNG